MTNPQKMDAGRPPIEKKSLLICVCVLFRELSIFWQDHAGLGIVSFQPPPFSLDQKQRIGEYVDDVGSVVGLQLTNRGLPTEASAPTRARTAGMPTSSGASQVTRMI